MFAAAAAGLTQPHPAVTLADATLREDEVAGRKQFPKQSNLFLTSRFLKIRSRKVAP
jgi:hypothetical protein